MEIPMFLFAPTASCITEHHWKEPVSVTFIPSCQVFIHIDEFTLSHLFSRLNRPSSSSLSSNKRWSRPLIIFTAIHWTLSSTSTSPFYSGALNSAQHWCCHSPCMYPFTQMWTQQCCVERKDRYSQSAGNALSKAFMNTMHLLYGKGMLLTLVQISVRITRWTPGKQFGKIHKEV